MRSYAAGTTVTSQQTLGEIMSMLGKRGVSKIAQFQDNDACIFTLAFEYNGIPFKLSLPLPNSEDPEFCEYYLGSVKYRRADSAIKERFDKELNRRWRAFGAVIKAKLIAVEEGISTIEKEFIGNVLLPSGQTVAETHAPELAQLAALGRLPALALPGASR